jgi:hypothetical protein
MIGDTSDSAVPAAQFPIEPVSVAMIATDWVPELSVTSVTVV